MRSIFNEQFVHSSVIQFSTLSISPKFHFTKLKLAMHDTTLFTQMVGMILLNFIKGNFDPTMPDKVQSIF